MPDVEVDAVLQRATEADTVTTSVDHPCPTLSNVGEDPLIVGDDGVLDRRSIPPCVRMVIYEKGDATLRHQAGAGEAARTSPAMFS